ncbi:hypothetical protein K492DRAFT_154903 [Lichtheimia hyalospora FSU 10163]|nr:hypothetical protein K492DRAFT_154903 [Lichtheimia hyalospora FSU 10163]
MQVGDFYELYETHASQYASQLDLKLTRKEMTSGITVDFAGFPSRALDRYLDMLVNQLGCRVALCEQWIKEGETTIRRRITRIITPGTVIEERFLDAHSNNYLLAVAPPGPHGSILGLAWIDVSVGEFNLQSSRVDLFKDDIARIRPREVIIPESLVQHSIMQTLAMDPDIALTPRPDSVFNGSQGQVLLSNMFTSLETNFSAAECGASLALLRYIDETHVDSKPRLLPPQRVNMDDTLQIDSAAVASLELVKTLREGRRTNSLLGTMDHTVTSTGSRLLAKWLAAPLTSLKDITRRQDVVEFFVKQRHILEQVRYVLEQSADAQRALQRLALGRGQHTDLMQIWATLTAVKDARSWLLTTNTSNNNEAIQSLVHDLDPHDTLTSTIDAAFDPDMIASCETRGIEFGYVRPQFDPEIMKLHNDLEQLNEQRKQLDQELKSVAGRSVSLLVNAIYSHIVEVNASQASKLLAHYPHATLVNQTKTKHRYQLDEWTKLSVQLQNTHARIIELESQVWDSVVAQVLNQADSIVATAGTLAKLDVLCSFAWVARLYRHVRPWMTADESHAMHIVGGRHPVVEAHLALGGKSFIKNDCHLNDKNTAWLLTGPNMGGKSTFLRQNAIILLLAHMGAFVPAREARIAIADRIFSRVGAADNLAEDQSTFMVEMSETATILKHATAQSFVIMDEVGRGTSTADGRALAFAILAYLHDHIQCRTLFATHYHELADHIIAAKPKDSFERVQCYKTDLYQDESGRFSFLHRVLPGVCRQSHGLKVAQLAGNSQYTLYIIYVYSYPFSIRNTIPSDSYCRIGARQAPITLITENLFTVNVLLL